MFVALNIRPCTPPVYKKRERMSGIVRIVYSVVCACKAVYIASIPHLIIVVCEIMIPRTVYDYDL